MNERPLEILNLYAGIGGNRKEWGEKHNITAVEINSDIANIYKKYYSNDTVIVGDAHEYLLNNFQKFDVIWSSPPCPSHSKMVKATKKDSRKLKYPDMTLYQEIILLSNFFKGLFVIENVIPYYSPLIEPTIEIDRHLFWTNFKINKIKVKKRKGFITATKKQLEKAYGYSDLPNIYIDGSHDPAKILRNCVNPKIGLHFLNRIEEILYNRNTHRQGLLF